MRFNFGRLPTASVEKGEAMVLLHASQKWGQRFLADSFDAGVGERESSCCGWAEVLGVRSRSVP